LAAVGALFALPVATHAAELEPGQFIRSTDGTVYWFAENERRYVFPDGATLQSWLGGTPGMLNDAPDAYLEQYPVGGPMTMRPGTRLVRFDSDPTTYVVTRGAVLRAVSDALATAFYGDDWQQDMDTLSVALFSNYRVGTPIAFTSDFDRLAEMNAATTPEIDLNLRRKNGLLSSSTVPFKAEVKTSVDPILVEPNGAPAIVSFRVTIEKPNTSIANLRTDLFREHGPWVKACLGIDLCVQDIDYQLITKDIEDRFYAIVSNDKGETLAHAYSPIITVRPIAQTLTAE
jgi:hypothetical protein